MGAAVDRLRASPRPALGCWRPLLLFCWGLFCAVEEGALLSLFALDLLLWGPHSEECAGEGCCWGGAEAGKHTEVCRLAWGHGAA